jgi:hypothetical protein
MCGDGGESRESGEPGGACSPIFQRVVGGDPIARAIVSNHPSAEAAMAAASKEYELTDAGWSIATDETSG